MPRPASRRRPLAYTPPEQLVAEIARIRRAGGEPAAVLTGIREWRICRVQPEAAQHVESWPGDDETFDKVPVIVLRGVGAPRVVATQQDLEDALLGGEDDGHR